MITEITTIEVEDDAAGILLGNNEEGFDFLGFHHRKVESWKRQGRYYLQKWPSDRNMAMIRSKIRDATGRHRVGRSVDAVVEELNPVLRGWGNYFDGVTPLESSAQLTAMYTDDWPPSPATRKAVEGGTGKDDSRHPGSNPSECIT